MIVIDLGGLPIDEKTARFAKSRFGDADSVAMHPAQAAAIVDTAIYAGMKFNTPYPMHSFTDFNLFEDPNIPNNEIHFRDTTGKIIAKIVNLAVPGGEDQQAASEIRGASEG